MHTTNSIEFIGPPGAGKSTIATELHALLKDAEVITNKSLHTSNANAHRYRSAAWYIITHPIEVWRFVRIARTTYAGSTYKFVRLCIVHQIDYRTGKLVLYDQGICNFILTGCSRGTIDTRQLSKLIQALRKNNLVLPTTLVVVSLNAHIVLQRIHTRPKDHPLKHAPDSEALEHITRYQKCLEEFIKLTSCTAIRIDGSNSPKENAEIIAQLIRMD